MWFTLYLLTQKHTCHFSLPQFGELLLVFTAQKHLVLMTMQIWPPPCLSPPPGHLWKSWKAQVTRLILMAHQYSPLTFFPWGGPLCIHSSLHSPTTILNLIASLLLWGVVTLLHFLMSFTSHLVLHCPKHQAGHQLFYHGLKMVSPGKKNIHCNKLSQKELTRLILLVLPWECSRLLPASHVSSAKATELLLFLPLLVLTSVSPSLKACVQDTTDITVNVSLCSNLTSAMNVRGDLRGASASLAAIWGKPDRGVPDRVKREALCTLQNVKADW